MNAYYKRTGNTKRISITTTPDRKISENLGYTPEEITNTSTMVGNVGTTEPSFHNKVPADITDAPDQRIDIKEIMPLTTDIKSMVRENSPEKIAERMRCLLEMYSSGDSAFSESDRAILAGIKKERGERLQEIMAKQSLPHEEAEKRLDAEIFEETEKYWARKKISGELNDIPAATTATMATVSADGIEGEHHDMVSATLPEPTNSLKGEYDIKACGFTGKMGKLVFSQNQSNLVVISDLNTNGLLPEIEDEDAFIAELKKEYRDRYEYSIDYGNYQISRFIASLSPTTVFSLKPFSSRSLQYGQRVQWESGNDLNNMDIRLIIEPQGRELYIEYPYGFKCGNFGSSATQKFAIKERLFRAS
jgi:hypothetical protein